MDETKQEQLGELAAALAKAQGEFTSVSKDCVNPMFGSKYASLGAIVDAIQKPLSENGLALAFLPIVNGKESAGVEGVLVHAKSGQQLRASCVLPLMERVRKDGRPLPIDAQSVGGALTYARRYCLSSLLNIMVDDDNDGNEISAHNAPSPGAVLEQASKQSAQRNATAKAIEDKVGFTPRQPGDDVPDDNVNVPSFAPFRSGVVWAFGRNKGKDLAEFSDRDLSSAFDFCLVAVADEAKAKWKAKNQELADLVMGEIERREKGKK